MTAVVRTDLYERVLLDPAAAGCNELTVLTGYASAAMAMRHFVDCRAILKADVAVSIFIGMTGEDGLDVRVHREFVEISRQLGGWVRVAYAPAGYADHSKIYLWSESGQPKFAWAGSANYSRAAFGLGSHFRRESMFPVDAALTEGTLREATRGFVSLKDPELSSKVHMYSVESEEDRKPVEGAATVLRPSPDDPAVELPLVQTQGAMGQIHNPGAGLNWGQRPSRRPEEAYIPIPKSVRDLGFFPSGGEPFPLHTTDGKVIFVRTAQADDKALHSVPDNATIGRYFRERLEVEGTRPISTEDLERFGAKHVTIWRRGDGSYLMDFSSVDDRSVDYYGPESTES